MHRLWETREWEQASTEEVTAALFDCPPFLDPRDMGPIKRLHPQAIVLYQELFYRGDVPQACRNVRQRAIGR